MERADVMAQKRINSETHKREHEHFLVRGAGAGPQVGKVGKVGKVAKKLPKAWPSILSLGGAV